MRMRRRARARPGGIVRNGSPRRAFRRYGGGNGGGNGGNRSGLSDDTNPGNSDQDNDGTDNPNNS